MEKIYKAFKDYIEDRQDFRFESTLENEEYKKMSMGLEEGDYRLSYMIRTEPIDNFSLIKMTTIRQFFIVFSYDEDYNIKNELIKQQICINLYTEWDDSEYSFHYFINKPEDFNIDKFEKEINEYCNKLTYNNYNIISHEVRWIFEDINNRLNGYTIVNNIIKDSFNEEEDILPFEEITVTIIGFGNFTPLKDKI